ncbi:MAG: four helix bundle protein, partial [Candidatus Hydrogenedentota bacterium]
MRIKRFEDLDCWKEARILVKLIYETINNSEKFRKDQGLRAEVSIMSNIPEDFSRQSNFLFISKASAAEVQSIFYIARDLNYFDKDPFNKIYQ